MKSQNENNKLINLFIKTDNILIAASIIKHCGKEKDKIFCNIINNLQDIKNEVPLLWDKVKILVDGEIILTGHEINTNKKRNAIIRLYDNIVDIYFSNCDKEYKCTRWIPSVNNRYRFRKADVYNRPQKEWDNMLLRLVY